MAQVYSAWIRKHLTVSRSSGTGDPGEPFIVTGRFSWKKSGNLESRKAYEEDTKWSIGESCGQGTTSDSGFYRVEQVEMKRGKMRKI